MAERKLTVRIVGDSDSLRRSFLQSSRSAKGFERDMSRVSRGALAGSGVFRSFGRSIAFASGGFLAFAGVGQFLRSSIDAAKEAEVTQRQLAVQLRNNGKSFADYRGQIDKTNLRLSAMSGFTKDELDASLTTILRTTGNVSKALRDNATAADLARARHISLGQAAFVIAKVEAGNTTLLRRQGFQIGKNATAEQALAIVRAKIAGQARAGTTEQERFGAVLHDTEIIIGTGLLPTLNKLLVSGTRWLQQMNESGRLQHDVERATADATQAFHDLRTVVHGVDRVTGSFKNTLELLLGLKVAATLSGWAGALGLFTARTTAAEGAAVGLRAELAGLAAINPIVIPITLAFLVDKAGLNTLAPDLVKIIQGKFGIGDSLIGSSGHRGVLGDLIHKTTGLGSDAAAKTRTVTVTHTHVVADPDHPLVRKTSTTETPTPPKGARLTATQRNTFFDNAITRLLDRSQDGGIGAQITKLQHIARLLTARIAVTKDITRKLNLEDQLVAVTRTIAGDRAQLTQENADRLAAQKQRLADAAQAIAARNQGLQFKALGLSAAGEQIIPVRVLKNELTRVSEAVKGTLLDTKKTRSLFANIRKIFAGGFGAVTKETKAQIKTMLDSIDSQLKNHARKNQTAYVHASTAAILAGITGLTPDQIRVLRARISQIGAGGTVPGTHTQAFALAGGDTVVHTQINLDGAKVASNTTRHQRKQGTRRADARRGPYAGRH